MSPAPSGVLWGLGWQECSGGALRRALLVWWVGERGTRASRLSCSPGWGWPVVLTFGLGNLPQKGSGCCPAFSQSWPFRWCHLLQEVSPGFSPLPETAGTSVLTSQPHSTSAPLLMSASICGSTACPRTSWGLWEACGSASPAPPGE